MAACQRGMSLGFTTAAALVHELMEARDDRRLLNLQRSWPASSAHHRGLRAASTTGAELLFEVFSQRYERGSIQDHQPALRRGTEVFGSERLTGALLDRLTHHVHGDERRQLPPQGQPAERCRASASVGPSGSRSVLPIGPGPAPSTGQAVTVRHHPGGMFYSAPVVRFSRTYPCTRYPVREI